MVARRETREKPERHGPSFAVSLVALIVVLAIFVAGIGILEYPPELMLIFAGAVLALFAIRLGASWDEIIANMGDKIKRALPAILILFAIGILIGTWMAAGTIPLLVYYGLQLIDPSYLFVLAFVVTAMVSTFTGTSWAAAGTVGVALIGVARTMDASLAITAGAVVSGAYFGDKLSPLSDTTNMSSIAAGADLYEHIRHMLYTALPSSVLAIVVFSIAGLSIDTSALSPGNVERIISDLDGLFNLTPVLLIPPVIVVVGSMLRKPPVVVLFLASTVALLLAALLQRAGLSSIFDAAVTGFETTALPAGEATSAQLTELLDRGGLHSMYEPTFFVFCAFFFASSLEVSNVLNTVLEQVVRALKSNGTLVLTTLASGFAIVSATSNALITYFLVKDVYGESFRRNGLHPVNLSRTMEDSVTITEVLMPWTVSGVFFATTLGVSNFAFLPWAVFNWSGLAFSALIAFASPITGNFGMRTTGEAETVR